LPFPGRTAAQLAAQHLNARPRLAGLQECDQELIGKALSKKPADRFESCRELVDALLAAGKRPAGAAAPTATAALPMDATQVSGMPTSTRLPSEMFSNLDAATRAIQQLTSPGLIQPSNLPPNMSRPMRMTQSRRSLSPADASALVGPTPELAALQEAPALVDLPPIEIDPQAPPLRPTLFIGLGGCGGQVLRLLRRRLDDRLPIELRMLAPMLLLDTDARELSGAHGGKGSDLRQDEILAMPLRRSQDYRNDSRRILEWLSRRWLYNIPRSQQTEGLRPLGRLALADHAPAATARRASAPLRSR